MVIALFTNMLTSPLAAQLRGLLNLTVYTSIVISLPFKFGRFEALLYEIIIGSKSIVIDLFN